MEPSPTSRQPVPRSGSATEATERLRAAVPAAIVDALLTAVSSRETRAGPVPPVRFSVPDPSISLHDLATDIWAVLSIANVDLRTDKRGAHWDLVQRIPGGIAPIVHIESGDQWAIHDLGRLTTASFAGESLL